jgi:hypothetical protein
MWNSHGKGDSNGNGYFSLDSLHTPLLVDQVGGEKADKTVTVNGNSFISRVVIDALAWDVDFLTELIGRK